MQVIVLIVNGHLECFHGNGDIINARFNHKDEFEIPLTKNVKKNFLYFYEHKTLI